MNRLLIVNADKDVIRINFTSLVTIYVYIFQKLEMQVTRDHRS